MLHNAFKCLNNVTLALSYQPILDILPSAFRLFCVVFRHSRVQIPTLNTCYISVYCMLASGGSAFACFGSQTTSHMGLLIWQLPGSILDSILGNEPTSYLVLRLWKCGDSTLNAKLRDSITYMNLRHVNHDTTKYPHLLSQLRKLRHLTLYSETSMMKDCVHLWKVELAKLSRSLEHLEIGGHDSFLSIMNCAYKPNPKDHDKYAYTSTNYPLGASTLINLGKLFPRLQTLKLVCKDPSYPRASVSDLAGLPPTLTHLEWPFIFLTRDVGLMSLLPRSLTRLGPIVEVGPFAFPALCFADAPPMLESINEIIWSVRDRSAIDLPRTLKRCSLEINSMDQESLEAIPPHLDELTISYFTRTPDSSMRWCSFLPKFLTKLCIQPLNANPDIHLLPRTLTELTCPNSSKWIESAFLRGQEPSWPPNLTKLQCRFSTLDVGQLAFLPKYMTSLFIELDIERDSQTFSASELPPALTALKLVHRTLKFVFYTGIFPSNLNSMTLSCLGDWVSGEVPEILDLLPSTLSELAYGIDRAYCTAWQDHTGKFPHLTALSLNVCGAELLSKLPPLLTTFKAQGVSNPEKDLNIFTSLPTGLKMLVILRIEPTELIYSNDSFANLPSLTNVYAPAFLRSRVLRGLPKTLTKFNVSLKTLDPSDAPFIPPRLHDFSCPVYDHIPGLENYWPILGTRLAPEGIKARVRARLFED